MHQDTAGFCALTSEPLGVLTKLLLDLLSANLHRWRQDLILDRPRCLAEYHRTNARMLLDLAVDVLDRRERRRLNFFTR